MTGSVGLTGGPAAMRWRRRGGDVDADEDVDVDARGVCGAARHGGGAPVVPGDGEVDDGVRLVVAEPRVATATCGLPGTATRRGRSGRRDAVDGGGGAPLHEEEKGGGQGMRAGEGSRARPETGGAAHRGGRNRRRTAADVAELDDEIGEPGGEPREGEGGKRERVEGL